MDIDSKIGAVIQTYFEGVYSGDVVALGNIFDERAQVFGEVNGQPYYKTIAEYLRGVAARKSPKESGDPYLMEMEELDVRGSIASAKLHSPMLGFNYYLVLSLVLDRGEWKIVNKTFTNRTA